ncbi:zinc finger (CCCH type) motif-containing protein [Cardiosporidium cionae]|uniref:Zinc finger (CCCH type) motif-containing protein n=1 Tax=Cardiosporidium cionae TaxID=476202 RepID=A0ABQ7JEA4_9APIC|nr:zinc finger (CCCH type) motif-containing protein [Cardiosporidium cionae]|eukprot:KAF8822288.1 zinc finger (CCCH type) motif-containing protein [Cardiosporidium cionae]
MSTYIPARRSFYSPMESNRNPRSLNLFHATLNENELACFRTLFCEAHQKGICKNADSCPHSHCLTWQRRDPYIAHYSSKQCPDIQFVKKGSKMCLNRRCNRGRSCSYAHSKEEELYHPLMYKTKLCATFPACTRFYCPFAHSQGELRKPFKIQSIRDIWGKTGGALPVLNSPCPSSEFLESPSINSAWSSEFCSYSSVPQFGPLGSLMLDQKQCFMTPELAFSHSLGKSRSFLPSIESKSMTKNSRRMSSADYLPASYHSTLEDSRHNPSAPDMFASPILASAVSEGGHRFSSHNYTSSFPETFSPAFPTYPRNVSQDKRNTIGASLPSIDSSFSAGDYLSTQCLSDAYFDSELERQRQDDILPMTTFSHPTRTSQKLAPTFSLGHSRLSQSNEGYSSIATLHNSLLNSLKSESKIQDMVARNENASGNICMEAGISKDDHECGIPTGLTDVNDIVANLFFNSPNPSNTLADKTETIPSCMEWWLQFCTSLNTNGDAVESNNNTHFLKHPLQKSLDTTIDFDDLKHASNDSNYTLYSNEELQTESPWLIDQLMVSPERSYSPEYLRGSSALQKDSSYNTGTLSSLSASNPAEILAGKTAGWSSDSCASTEIDDSKKELYAMLEVQRTLQHRHEIARTCTTSPLSCDAMYRSPLNTPISTAHDADMTTVQSVKNESPLQAAAKDNFGASELDMKSNTEFKENAEISLSQEMWNALKSLSHSDATQLVQQLDDPIGPILRASLNYDNAPTQAIPIFPSSQVRSDIRDFSQSFSLYGNPDICETSNQKTSCKITPLHAKARSDVDSGLSNAGSSEFMSYFSSNASEKFQGDSDSDHSKGHSPSIENEKGNRLLTNLEAQCIGNTRKETQISGHGDEYDKLWEEICHGI